MLPLHRENRKKPDWLCREKDNGDIAGIRWNKERKTREIVSLTATVIMYA